MTSVLVSADTGGFIQSQGELFDGRYAHHSVGDAVETFMTTPVLLLAGDEWFLRELVSFLTHEDAICLTLLAVECKWSSVTHAMLYKPLPTRAISTQKLADYAAERGWWHHLALVRGEDLRLRLRLRRQDKQIQSGTHENAFARCQRIQRLVPRPFPTEVMFATVRRGSLDEVKRLHTCSKSQYPVSDNGMYTRPSLIRSEWVNMSSSRRSGLRHKNANHAHELESLEPVHCSSSPSTFLWRSYAGVRCGVDAEQRH